MSDPENDTESDWEEVPVPEEEKHLEITISTTQKQKWKPRLTTVERTLRVNSHKLHTLVLLANAQIRNKWINDPLLQARLMSLTPLSLQNSFAMIHKSRVPEKHKRGRMFETAMNHLAFWWARTFFDVTFEGHLRNRTFESVHRSMEAHDLVPPEGIWDVDILKDVLDDEGEVIKSPKSLMKHALMKKGTRDTSAQLFTSLCRGLGIPARLVVSLQSVPWQSNVGKAKTDTRKGKGKMEDVEEEPVVEDPKGKGKSKEASPAFAGSGQRLDGEPVKSEKAKGKEKAKPAVKLRKKKPKGNVLGSGPSSSKDPATTPPVFWTEVFSRPDARWIPVDPIRGLVNQPYIFDPSVTTEVPIHTSVANANPGSAYARPSAPTHPGKATKRADSDNRMLYVVALEDDGYGRDVTRRYARNYSAKIARIQGGDRRRGGGRAAWWARVLEGIMRPYRLARDDAEDAELDALQLHEGMPTTIGEFKDHPMYVLQRHLTQTQTLYPSPPLTRELGKFRGESVYPRSAVVTLKTAENWMRSEGRQIKEGQQPLKFIKLRASTLGKMREAEMLREGLRVAGENENAEGSKKTQDQEPMQGMYALFQTTLYVPDPIVDGVIPKNNFGNIDLYVPSMLPAGAVHIPYKGTAKIAKKLGIQYAEAVTGFEFKHRAATPIMSGIVVAAENEGLVLQAYHDAESDAAEKARIKRRQRVLKRWVRLVHGLRIRRDLQEEYKDRQPAADAEKGENIEIKPGLAGGGFVVGADAVVQAYQLPKSFIPSIGADSAGQSRGISEDDVAEERTYQFETMDVDEEPSVVEELPPAPSTLTEPKSMMQLAEEASARLQAEFARDNVEEDEVEELSIAPAEGASNGKAKKSRAKKAAATPKNPKPKGRFGTRSSARKRRRNDASDSDASGGEQEEEEREEPAPRAKRVKAAATTESAPSAAPAGRSLRPRRSKTQTQLEEEEERERAFQRAVAE
ncbi:hypothetical protein FB45DRAFT_1052641 [Roridomyces roridus]|uniref:Rad4-domain-containing protein n=1 Tax=Roridomyces roridus TaxID=1738132 RepID=A0AAD7CA74_9AGAR|nr:hypothetical protein FB45DRAFT_1052641 [Roridomyces roridus]